MNQLRLLGEPREFLIGSCGGFPAELKVSLQDIVDADNVLTPGLQKKFAGALGSIEVDEAANVIIRQADLFSRSMQRAIFLPPFFAPLFGLRDIDQDRGARLPNTGLPDQLQNFQQPGCSGSLQRVFDVLLKKAQAKERCISSRTQENGKRDQRKPGQALEPFIDPVHTVL